MLIPKRKKQFCSGIALKAADENHFEATSGCLKSVKIEGSVLPSGRDAATSQAGRNFSTVLGRDLASSLTFALSVRLLNVEVQEGQKKLPTRAKVQRRGARVDKIKAQRMII